MSELAIRYRAPARFDDVLVVASRLVEVRAASARIQQTVRRGNAVLSEAEVTAVLVAPNGRPRRQPAAWRDAFAALLWQGEDQGA